MSTQIQPPTLDRYGSLQDILCCPNTKGPLRLAGIEELLSCLSDAERERIPDGTIGAFMSDAINRAYPLTERVAYFLKQDSLEIRTLSGAALSTVPTTSVDEIKRSVKDWYDRFGWKKNELGLYMDSALFSQNKPVGHGLYERARSQNAAMLQYA